MIPEGFDRKLVEEIFQGPFKRVVNLSNNIDQENISFDYQGGF
jgi:HSP20 family molecular chaperone IbpA